MSYINFTKDELVKLLNENDRTSFYYTEKDRERVLSNPNLKKYISQIVDTAEEMIDEPIIAISFSKFRLFAETGDRGSFETSAPGGYFNHRKFLVTFGLLSWLYGEERYIKKLEDAIWAVCDEYSWSLPAHMNGQSLTRLETEGHTIDLFASETGSALAEIINLVGDRLAPIVVERAKHEIEKRIFDRAFVPYRWKQMTNNWSAVCSNNVLLACAYLMEDNERLAEYYMELLKCVDVFMSGFPNDGCCLEGVGYWHYGFGNFITLAETLKKRTGGAIDLFKNEKVLSVARFVQSCYFPGGRVVSFSDGGSRGRRSLSYASKLAEIYPGECTIDSLCHIGDYPKGGCWCFSTFLRTLVWTTSVDPSLVEGKYGTCMLPDAQWYISTAENGVSFACKAGHNGEAHNHNDVGSFLIYKNGEAMLLDIGAAEYTRFYFSAQRYELHYCAGSRGHSVPLINGQEQKCGRGYSSKDTVVTERGLTSDISGAYGIDSLKSLVRSFDFSPDGVITITDSYSFSEKPESVIERFITQTVPVIEDGYALITVGNETVKLCYDTDKLSAEVIREVESFVSGKERVTYRVDFLVVQPSTEFTLSFKIF